jgi:hypothetical protein
MKTIGYCPLTVIPLRAEPSDRAEMVNQILFGETFDVVEQKPKWSKIALHHDGYEGWIDHKQWQPISSRMPDPGYTTELIDLAMEPATGYPVKILLGSPLPVGGHFQLGNHQYQYDGQRIAGQKDRAFAVEQAYLYLNAPYLWGGRTPLGIDCSGLTQMVYRLAGYSIPRDAWQQAQHGQTLSFIEEAQPGDLAFFDNEEGKIIHVGILLADYQIIHASGKVRIDRLDQTGIFNPETGRHTHRLRMIKNILDDPGKLAG